MYDVCSPNHNCRHRIHALMCMQHPFLQALQLTAELQCPLLRQEAFAVSDTDASAAPKGYINQLRAAGKVYNVYVHR